MRKVFKNISLVTLWLAMAAIWAHMIIPHDHHISETFSDQEQTCPASHHQSGDKSEIPVHCHAFNDLTSEKARVYNISPNIQNGSNSIFVLPNDLISEPIFPCSGIIDFQTPFFGYCTNDLCLLRAPPALV